MNVEAAGEQSAFTITANTRHYVLAVLTIVYTLAFVDRQIVNILAEPIKQELHLADWQMGALAGFAFAMLYTVLGLPIARYSERGNRSRVIAVALLVWSGFTALSGTASSFLGLLLARVGVGVGEAGCLPPAHSLISDITPRERRASALSIFSAGLPLGSLVGMALGGLVAHSYGWRAAFFIVGMPGVLLAFVVLLTIRDPRTHASTDHPRAAPDVPPIREALAQLRARRSFGWIAAGAALLSFVGYAHQTFYASFFLRNHGEEIDRLAAMVGVPGRLSFLGICLGLIIGVAGTLGSTVGGRLSDRHAARRPGGYMTVPIWGAALAAPLLALVFIVPSALIALVLLTVPNFLKSMWYGPVFASVQSLAPPRTRATAVAVFLFIVNVVGLGLGPLCGGALSDLLAQWLGPADGLRVALIVLSLLLLAPAGCFVIARRTLAQDMVS